MQLGQFAVAAMIAGVGDDRGSLGGLGMRLGAGDCGAFERGGNIEGEAAALQCEVREVEPHLLARDVLHLSEVGADALNQVRLAFRRAAAKVSDTREQGFGNAVIRARLVNHKTMTAATIDSRHFIAARRRTDAELIRPPLSRITTLFAIRSRPSELEIKRVYEIAAFPCN